MARQVEYTERQQEHELNTLRLKIQLQEAMIRGEAAGVPVNGDRQNNHNSGVRVGPKLKIPPFEDGKDDLDAYLRRFERYVESQGIDRGDWAVHLSTLLRGKALEVYSRLPTEDALNYDMLMTALQKRYQMTEDGFRNKF